MNIVYVSRELPPSQRCGGIGSYVWDIAVQIVRAGCNVTVICASDNTVETSDKIIEGVRVIRLSGGDFAIPGVESAGNNLMGRNLRRVVRYRPYRQKVADCLDRLIDKEKFDLVEFPEYGNEAAVWMHRLRRIPMVIRLHTPSTLDREKVRRIPFYPWTYLKYKLALLEYQPLHSAQALTSCSKVLAEWVRRDAGLGNKYIEIIPNPIDVDYWTRQESAYKHSEDGAKQILFAGTIVESKGVSDLVDAVLMLRSKGHDIKLTLAGRLGSFGKSLDRKIKKSKAMNYWLKLLGPISRDELLKYYNNTTIACFPSWWEAYGIVCVEAMSCGALVIGSSAGGMADIIQHGVDGFLAEPKDPVMLSHLMKHIFSLPEKTKLQIRSNAQKKIRSTFDMKVVLPNLLKFYEQVILGKNRLTADN